MESREKTAQELMEELAALQGRLGELEALEHARRRAADEVERSRTYAQSLIDSSLDMIIAVDTERRITEFNRAAEEAFGYTRDEVVGQHVDMLYADPAVGHTAHDTARRTGRFTAEIVNRKKTGETFPSFLAASVLRDPHGRVLGVMGISRDITERKLVERAFARQARIDRQRMQMLDQASRARTELLATLSDDLRTRLNAIIGFAEILQEERFGALTERQRRCLGHILACARHVLATIDEILRLGAVEDPYGELAALTARVFSGEAQARELQLTLPIRAPLVGT